ncbi:MAG: hypothetical protein AB3N23_02135 [Paracoccaceae bacterium]
MKRILLGVGMAAIVGACGGGNPFAETTTTPDTGTGTDTTNTGNTGTAITSTRTVPPGTTSPEASATIFRTEPTSGDGAQAGDGQVSSVAYNSTNDTFTVDGLAFDGDNVYTRGGAVSSLGPFAVYEAVAQFPDSSTGTPINQFTHRAIYGVSTSGSTEFAIVRTGAYRQFGFGGFVYQRNGNVQLPTTGQANYTGQISGIRDFDGQGGLQYSRGNIAVAIDFNDFNSTTGTRGDGVQGQITGRTIFDVNGNDVTSTVVSAINSAETASLTAIPTLHFTVGPGVLDNNGEILGDVSSAFVNNAGETVLFESGKYYAIIAGDNAGEIVGIVTSTTQVGQPDGVTVRDTGGFIVYRN